MVKYNYCQRLDEPLFNGHTENQFSENIAPISDAIRVMYDEIDADYLYEPFLHIALADIDFDGTPEFFYGYQTITGSHNKIWYRAYSFTDCTAIDSEHVLSWNTYIQSDVDCAFFTGPDNFIEGYYLDSNAKPCFVTKAVSGSVASIRTDFTFIEYTNSKLYIETGFECDENLLPLKQVWMRTNPDSLETDITKLLADYFLLE